MPASHHSACDHFVLLGRGGLLCPALENLAHAQTPVNPDKVGADVLDLLLLLLRSCHHPQPVLKGRVDLGQVAMSVSQSTELSLAAPGRRLARIMQQNTRTGEPIW